LISFQKLGNYGRLGNQLFQYAFLRVTAERLKTQFYCPTWEGDQIFDLRDQDVRANAPTGILNNYDQAPDVGFCCAAQQLSDNTDIQGFFQSEKYYPDKQRVKSWFSFRPAIVETVHSQFGRNYLTDAVSISFRLDSDYANTREYFPSYQPNFYNAALSHLKASGPVLVFADRLDLARKFVAQMRKHDFVFTDSLDSHQQLYLMTQCRANVITNSTFTWWGAWLNQRNDREIVTPSAWCRPGVPNTIADILCDDWIKLRATVPIWDHFQTWRIRHLKATFRRYRAKRM
jgi:Glycosyl transferase family 11